MTQRELSALERWKHVASEANYGLIKVRDIESS